MWYLECRRSTAWRSLSASGALRDLSEKRLVHLEHLALLGIACLLVYLEEECSEHLEHLVYLDDGARDALVGEPISALKVLNVLGALVEALGALGALGELGVLGVRVPCTTVARGVNVVTYLVSLTHQSAGVFVGVNGVAGWSAWRT